MRPSLIRLAAPTALALALALGLAVGAPTTSAFAAGPADGDKAAATNTGDSKATGTRPRTFMNPLLIALGQMARSHAYTMYMAIGLAADSLAENLYKPEEIQRMTKGFDAQVAQSTRSLRGIDMATLAPDDRAVLGKLIGAHDRLKTMSRSLAEYAKTLAPKKAAEFQTAREAAWTAIQAIVVPKK